MARADILQESERRRIARQQDVGAVVDAHAGDAVVIRAAAAAGIVGRLVDDGRHALPGKTDGAGQAGETGADDVNGARHQINA